MTLLARMPLVVAGALACTPIGASPTPGSPDDECPPLESASQPPPLADVAPQAIPRTVVALPVFVGPPPPSGDLRPAIADALVQRGFTTVAAAEPTTDLVVAASYAPGTPMTVTFAIHDVARDVSTALVVALADGDLVAPLVVPTTLADTLADHVVPPLPITDEERWILEQLDEPPYRAATEFCNRESW